MNYRKPEHVVIKIYNVLGKEISTLVNSVKDSGIHEVNFDASNLSSGMYFYRIEADHFVDQRKMILLK